VLTKHRDRLVRLVSPTLEPGERAEFTGIARLSPVSSSGRRARGEAFVVLTDRRLMVIGKGFASRPTPRVSWVIARDDISPLRFTRGVQSCIDLDVAHEPSALRLTFPRAERAEAEWLASALDLRAA
jgi:hypothetical protein